MNAPPEFFTASQIARALGCSKQNIHKQLGVIAADGEKLVAGNLAKAWRIESLPIGITRALTTKADAKRYRSIVALLREPCDRYETAIPLREIAPAAIDRARKLQRALQGSLGRRNNKEMSAANLARIGIEDYNR